ncbi:MAG: heme-binding protein [Actinomycetota bacterium]|nr:heme-binding protein [Actinomycetota bacterium]
MTASVSNVRRGLLSVLAGGALVFGPAAILAPVATAQPDSEPDCSAANVARTVSAATAAEGDYLVANPPTHSQLSSISSQPQDQAQAAYNSFFEQNPQARDDLAAIHQPVSTLNEQCGFNVTPTLVAGGVWQTEPQTAAGVNTPNLDQNEEGTPAGVEPPS